MTTSDLTVKPLDSSTWQDFARLVEKHNGVWGGCWCLFFHQKGTGSKEGNKTAKHGLVCAGKARAALVFDGAEVVDGASLVGLKTSLRSITRRPTTKPSQNSRIGASLASLLIEITEGAAWQGWHLKGPWN